MSVPEREREVFRLEGVSYAYEGRDPALDHVSLVIREGESVVLLGSNGSGKSTLLLLLDGLIAPTTGTIDAFGSALSPEALRDEAANAAFRSRVGLVFQDPDVQLFSPSVWDEVAFAPLQLGLSREDIAHRVDSTLESLRIDKLRDRPPHRLSVGEKRRVALASVLSLMPEVYLLDEPTSGLDPRSQSWLLDFILDQRQAGKTIVTATHDLSIVDDLADRVVVLGEDHRLVAQGAAREILADDALLLACNLVHAHRHRHAAAGEGHAHAHLHPPLHDHTHSKP
jgi:cobalt/nickel transport system ATP-binding protein